ncbi:MAG: DUF542 domain-containing protein [Bacteroidota bacterium]|nr:DUF542 domain-containing protein [Bacteroidota bacterium]
MELPEIIDVALIERGLKHSVVFKKLDALTPGSSIIIRIDDDPIPLYDYLLAKRGQTFVWELVKMDQLTWQIKIIKGLQEHNEETIGEIVARDYGKAAIFKSLGIDFSCGGKQTIEEVCKQHGLAASELSLLLAAETQPLLTPDMDFQSWDIGFMCKYMVKLHHLYLKSNTPFIQELSKKISKTYSEKYPEIIEVVAIFEKISKLLMRSMDKEEQNIFPYIIALNEAYKNGTVIKEAAFGPLSFSVYLLEAEHENLAEDFRMLRTLTRNYQLPPYVPHSYGILYKMLQEYEDDIYLHLHLENNILFPKAIEIENEMREKKFIQ